MWKSLTRPLLRSPFVLRIAQSLAIILLTLPLILSPALAQETPVSETVKTPTSAAVNCHNTDVSTPAKPTADSTTVTPSSEMEKAPAVSTPRLTYPNPPHPYDMEAIEKFNADLYGEGN